MHIRDNPPAITFLIESRQELHLLLTSYRTAPPSPVQPLILVDLAENSSILATPKFIASGLEPPELTKSRTASSQQTLGRVCWPLGHRSPAARAKLYYPESISPTFWDLRQRTCGALPVQRRLCYARVLVCQPPDKSDGCVGQMSHQQPPVPTGIAIRGPPPPFSTLRVV
ncbi:hypothetical protein PGT21_018585 [Puccinia graminis f. sp. tritici]|uniref:Uncharacterized protein n=1 Tax=Puccinia graminis f. sp. tritici TaxID=56615 RepID=A0A5B0R120_PUCGR|nr:hypothetical protein PGT21_018585 [Puccinia graminis f. sp. tritici]